MECPSCKRDNPSGSGFCLGCGVTLARSCTGCGQELPPDAGFCNVCGQRLDAAQPEAPQRAAAPAPSSFGSGRYRVERFLGEGAKKRVYLARDTRLDRDVAILVIKREGLDAEGRLRVQREAQSMGRLGDHPHIVTVHDVAEEGDDLFIVSQYMAGGDLETRLAEAEDHRLPIEETLAVGTQLCQALEHAHARGVIHRDLKPGNIYLAEDGSAALGDFGLAVSLDHTRLTREGMMLGTVLTIASGFVKAPLPITTESKFSMGAQVSTWGYPEGYGGQLALLSVGHLAGVEEQRSPSGKVVRRWVVNGAFNRGNSGGPLLDTRKAAVIGIISSKLAPMSKELSAALRKLKRSSRPGDKDLAKLIEHLRNQTQLVIGFATMNKDLRAFLVENGIEP